MSGTMLKIVQAQGDAEEIIIQVERKGWWRRECTELRADAWGLEAHGALGGYRRGVLRVAWSQVTELHYAPGRRGSVAGLYVRTGMWNSRCVLPWVGEAEAERVIAAIGLRSAGSGVHLEGGAGFVEMGGPRSRVELGMMPAWPREGGVIAASTGQL